MNCIPPLQTTKQAKARIRMEVQKGKIGKSLGRISTKHKESEGRRQH